MVAVNLECHTARGVHVFTVLRTGPPPQQAASPAVSVDTEPAPHSPRVQQWCARGCVGVLLRAGYGMRVSGSILGGSKDGPHRSLISPSNRGLGVKPPQV